MDNNMISTGLVSELSVQSKQAKEPKSNELGQDVFLELMITQMQNQNPLDPQDNSEFVAQLAQFSSVEGLDKLNTTTENMAATFQSSQALQASSMVGRKVKVETESAKLEADGLVAGTVELPFSTNSLEMNIYNSAGELAARDFLGAKAAGDISFSWNGQNELAEDLPLGTYRFEVLATASDGSKMPVTTHMSANVDSVTVGKNGTLTLNVAGVGPVSMSSVKEIL